MSDTGGKKKEPDKMSSRQKNCDEASLTLLGQEQGESALERDTLARPLVVGGEARGMRRLGDLAVGDLFEGVEAGAAGVEGVHQMHGGRVGSERFDGGFESMK